jgi:hypothetical protein
MARRVIFMGLRGLIPLLNLAYADCMMRLSRLRLLLCAFLIGSFSMVAHAASEKGKKTDNSNKSSVNKPSTKKEPKKEEKPLPEPELEVMEPAPAPVPEED